MTDKIEIEAKKLDVSVEFLIALKNGMIKYSDALKILVVR